MKRLLVLLVAMLGTAVAPAQISWEEGEYVEFTTKRSGIHVLDAQLLQRENLMQLGDRLDRVVIEARMEGVLSHINDTGASFEHHIPYFIEDDDLLLDANSRLYFYLNAPYSVEWDSVNNRYEYGEHAYSNTEHFLVSVAADPQDFIMEADNDAPLAAPNRTISQSNQFYVRDTAQYNLVGTGRRWFGELFDFVSVQNFSLPFVPVPSSTMDIALNAVARSSSSNTSVAVQGGGSVDFPAVSSASVSNYVVERGLSTSIPANPQVTLIYDKTSDNGAAMWLDQLKVNYTTNNDLLPNNRYQKRFQNYPRHIDSVSSITLNALNPLVFEITTTYSPKVVPLSSVGANFQFRVKEDKFREYVAVEKKEAFQPQFFRVGKKLDLTQFSGTNSVIITPDSLLMEGNRLAELQGRSGINSVAVSLEEIYAFTNAGTPDIAAIRQFLVALRSNPQNDLEYLTLLGDASYDYKGTLPNETNLVPTFQSYGSFSLYTSYITDDYFGYLDHEESTNWFVDNLDLGIGRIPVKSREEANEVIDKLERYQNDSRRFGPWRGNIVLVADDVDHAWEREFAVVQDALAKRLDTLRPELNQIKIYSDAYLQESKPGSQRYPEARDQLFRNVQNGALLVSFVGHGGEVGWSTERILQLDDINSWSNEVQLPVFTTITCEFTRFDDPDRISAGEQLFLNPQGGAIALYSTTRSVFATNSTYDLNRLLNQQMLTSPSARLGDVLRYTKNNNISGDKIRFALIGDPTMPLARPEEAVVLDTINNVAWNEFQDTLSALSWVEIKGHISESGMLDADFNGKVWLRFYDKEQTVQTRRNDSNGGVFSFQTQNNTVFKGEATVKDGLFTVQFRVPLDINLSIGEPKVIAYAASQDKDAWGGRGDLLIGGIYDGTITDKEGPEVRLFVNDTMFESGGISSPDPLAIGLLKDESGINAVGLGIGHNIELTLDGDPINVNDAYTANVDDFTSGRIEYPYYDLSPGEHMLSLRAWDVLNQWGYDEITFTVIDEAEPILSQLLVWPNPFDEVVHFNLQHNQKGEAGQLELVIIDNSGNLVWKWSETTILNGATSDLPSFNVGDIPSGKISSGFYHARVQWTREVDGKTSRIQEKLIFIR